MDHPEPEITILLKRSREAEPGAMDALAEAVYGELKKVAAALMAHERWGHTLQPTALVNEAWMKLAGVMDQDWRDRRQFFATAAHLQRQVLVSAARAHKAEKRSGCLVQVPLDEGRAAAPEKDISILALEEALERLEKVDQRKVRVLEMRYFGGMTKEMIADELGISTATVGRELRLAAAWMRVQMGVEIKEPEGDGRETVA
jgi:RNA polymerase sigma-70 factor, ECF subfamily